MRLFWRNCARFATKPKAPIRLFPKTPTRAVPDHIPRPPYVLGAPLPGMSGSPTIHDENAIQHMRKSCQLAAIMRQLAANYAKAGVSTDDVDGYIHNAIIAAGAYPSPLGYLGFPKSIGSSVNEIITHGMPDTRPLEDGDLFKVDITVYLNGFHGDCAGTVMIGQVDPLHQKVTRVARECTLKAISRCGPGVPLNKIGSTISEHARQHGFQVVSDYCGHGIGRHFHQAPFIVHVENDDVTEMKKGMIFTIEPMITIGSAECEVLEDKWAVRARDRSFSAQFEETILITDNGAEILTKPLMS
eukprot:TRINITY_DN2_c1_g1_i1.p1 TRINITY_DN2_c1_g1~~TRINITY_DN2_c1_g1_i1.p1  ORF type:complete len:301 (+),score=51.74 TRINITY_DN2_c1_g1_i1:120-1022(+)